MDKEFVDQAVEYLEDLFVNYQFDDAREYAKRILSHSSDNTLLASRIADVFFEHAQPEINGLYVRYFLPQARRLYNANQYVQVSEMLRKMQRLGVKDPRVLDLLAYSLKSQGKLPQAIAIWCRHLDEIIEMCLAAKDLLGAEWRLAFLYQQGVRTAAVVRKLHDVYIKQEDLGKAQTLFELHEDVLMPDTVDDDEEETEGNPGVDEDSFTEEISEIMRRYLPKD